MANQKSPKRKFNGMSYPEAQRSNSKNRIKLHQDDQRYLRDNGYKNVSWDKVIKLYLKIEEFLDKYKFEDLNLEELFLEFDRIGNKYLTSQEIEEYQQKLSQEVNEIA